jgi:hypothetical protein
MSDKPIYGNWFYGAFSYHTLSKRPLLAERDLE